MHPLIAFLSFLFAPADDWMLKRGYELVLDPREVPAVVQTYDETARLYPSPAVAGEPSADVAPAALWAKILSQTDHRKEARERWTRILESPTCPIDLADDARMELGSVAFRDSDFAEARKQFSAVVDRRQDDGKAGATSHRHIEALTQLVMIELAAGDNTAADNRAKELSAWLNDPSDRPETLFPLALVAYVHERYEEAILNLSKMGDDAKAHYFIGLAQRNLDKPQLALAEWQKIRAKDTTSMWAELASFQIAETYYSFDDTKLTRAICERELALNPESDKAKQFTFRLATLDMKAGNYEGALAKLALVEDEPTLAERTNILMAESMIQTGQNQELFKAFAKKDLPPSAESQYQMAWSSLFANHEDKALNQAEVGLADFYDPNITPRLLLLQGIAFERTDQEAEALATYQVVADRFPNTISAAKATHWTLLAYMRLGRYQEAVTHGSYLWGKLNDNIRRDHPDASFWLGEANLKLDRNQEADDHYSDFIAYASPDNELYPFAQFEKSVTLAKLDEPTMALAMLNEFKDTATRVGMPSWKFIANLQRGHILYNSRKYEQAIAAYRDSGNSPKALYQEAKALAKLDFYTDAISAWDKLVTKYPNNEYAEDSQFRIARTYFELGQATAAVAAYNEYREAFASAPRAKDALLQSGHALYNAGDVAEAAKYYSLYLTQYKETDDLATVTPYLASCYAQMNKPLDEIEALTKGLPPADVIASLRWAEGAKQFNEKSYDAAANTFAKLASDTPVHENADASNFYRGESLFFAEKYGDAEGAFKNYYSTNSATDKEFGPVALFHRGISTYKQDRLLASADVFHSFLEHYPTHELAPDAKDNMVLAYHYLGAWDRAEVLKAQFENIATKPAVAEETTTPSEPAAVPAENSQENVAEETSTEELDKDKLIPAPRRHVTEVAKDRPDWKEPVEEQAANTTGEKVQ